MRHIAFLSMALVMAAGCKDPTQPGREEVSTRPSFDGAVVQVAHPTGNPARDVPNIEAALAAATPGAIVQFAKGTYAIEATTKITISVPAVTLQGHSKGTTIRGVTQFASPDFLEGHFVLNGGEQTVRDLNFLGFGTALSLGEVAPAARTGGYRIENSTFKNGDVAFEFVTFTDQVSTVRGNKFINVTIPFFVLGKTVHLLGNSNTNPDPTATPPGRPFNAGILLPEFLSDIRINENNLLEGNTVDRNADGFILATGAAGSLRNNVIRRNTFTNQVVFINDDGSTGDNASMVVTDGPGVEQNLIEQNVLRGSEGNGVVIVRGHHNRIVGNQFFDLPGVRPVFNPPPGTAILLGEESAHNQVRDNQFSNVLHTVVDQGFANVVGKDQSASLAAASALRPSLSAARSRMLNHPKLRALYERMGY